MGHQPRLSTLGLWERHERLCMQLLREALEALDNQPPREVENNLNRLLYRAINRATQQLIQSGEHHPSVVYEGRNPPAGSDSERAEREFKIPDFYWAYVDPHASDPNYASKQFVVECKRLTRPPARYARKYMKLGLPAFWTQVMVTEWMCGAVRWSGIYKSFYSMRRS